MAMNDNTHGSVARSRWLHLLHGIDAYEDAFFVFRDGDGKLWTTVFLIFIFFWDVSLRGFFCLENQIAGASRMEEQVPAHCLSRV